MLWIRENIIYLGKGNEAEQKYGEGVKGGRRDELAEEVQEGALHGTVAHSEEANELPSGEGSQDPVPRASGPGSEGR